MAPLLLALTLAATTPEALAQAGLDAALAAAGARAELVELGPASPRGCQARSAEAPRPFSASGRVALRFAGVGADGEPCEAWAWARVRVRAPALVTTRPVTEGEPLAGATSLAEREVAPGREPVASLPEGAVAERYLPPGAALAASDLRVGPRPGDPIVVVLHVGELEISQQARAVPCRRGHACALLPTGRRVEGALVAGRLVLESP